MLGSDLPLHQFGWAAWHLESHSLWATEAFGLNDVSELRRGWRFVKEWLASQAADEVIEEMQQHVEGDTDRYMGVEAFRCCASTLPDDASQWRLYADDARGYSVSIDPMVDLGVAARVGASPIAEPPSNGRTVDIAALFREHRGLPLAVRNVYQ